MNLKWLFWTVLLATLVFFSVVYFGMKYNWVSGSKPSKPKVSTTQSAKTVQTKDSQSSDPKSSSLSSQGNGVEPELLDEVDISTPGQTLGSTELTIEEVVAQCQALSRSVGVPPEKLEQSVSECVDRNSTHLTVESDATDSDRNTLVREQCQTAITNKELMSDEEIKMLVDECVATMTQ